jgi:carboxymethylenebutenolidase
MEIRKNFAVAQPGVTSLGRKNFAPKAQRGRWMWRDLMFNEPPNRLRKRVRMTKMQVEQTNPIHAPTMAAAKGYRLGSFACCEARKTGGKAFSTPTMSTTAANSLGKETTMHHAIALLVGLFALVACATARAAETPSIPPGEADAKKRIETSPRHGEYVDITVPGAKTPTRAYVVYPERKDKAPVVIIIHEIFGLSDWIKSVADQLAADGFIAIAPDFLSGHGPNGGGTDAFKGRDEVTKAVREVKIDEVTTVLNATRDYAAKLPAATAKFATVGFCWGGTQSFAYAARQPDLSAAVVYYGTSPSDAKDFEKIKAPVLGLYGSDDARVDATIPPAQEQMNKLGKEYTPHLFDGAGHGFLRGQSERDGANLKAAQQAWPLTIEFLKKNTAG